MARPFPIVVLVALAIYHLSVCHGVLRTKVLTPDSVDPSSFTVIQSIPDVSTVLQCSVHCMSKGERCTGMRIFENNGGCELGYVEDNPTDGVLSIYTTKMVDRSSTTSSATTSTSSATSTTSSSSTSSSTATTSSSSSTSSTTTSTSTTTTATGCYQKVAMPSGKTGVTRDEAKSQCQASGFWLPEMFARPDFNTAQTAAAFGAASNKVDFWTGLTNANSAIISCSGDSCIGGGWMWEHTSSALASSHLSFYDDELMNATVNQSPCVKNHYYPATTNAKHILYSEPCASQLTVIICQKSC